MIQPSQPTNTPAPPEEVASAATTGPDTIPSVEEAPVATAGPAAKRPVEETLIAHHNPASAPPADQTPQSASAVDMDHAL